MPTKSTRDIEVMIIKNDSVASSCFLGVFVSNDLSSKIPIFPSDLIANTDSSDKPRQHWVAMYFLDVDKKEFFDIYGFPPNYYPGDTEHNVGTLQALHFNVCGYYCILFVSLRSPPGF